MRPKSSNSTTCRRSRRHRLRKNCPPPQEPQKDEQEDKVEEGAASVPQTEKETVKSDDEDDTEKGNVKSDDEDDTEKGNVKSDAEDDTEKGNVKSDDEDDVFVPDLKIPPASAAKRDVKATTCGRNNGTCKGQGARKGKDSAKRSTHGWRKCTGAKGDQVFEVMIQTAHNKRDQIVERVRTYSELLKFHKTIKEDQVVLYRRLQQIDELYLKNTAAVLQLGFCPFQVHHQTSPVGDKLMAIHRKLRIWDKKIDELCEVVKERSTRKSAATVLHILKICNTCNLPIAVKKNEEYENYSDICLPEIVWDLQNPYLEQVDIPKLKEEWKEIREDIQERLLDAESLFKEVCGEYGVTRAPEKSPSRGRTMFPYNLIDFNLNPEEYGQDEGASEDNQKQKVGDVKKDEEIPVAGPSRRRTSSYL